MFDQPLAPVLTKLNELKDAFNLNELILKMNAIKGQSNACRMMMYPKGSIKFQIKLTGLGIKFNAILKLAGKTI